MQQGITSNQVMNPLTIFTFYIWMECHIEREREMEKPSSKPLVSSSFLTSSSSCLVLLLLTPLLVFSLISCMHKPANWVSISSQWTWTSPPPPPPPQVMEKQGALLEDEKETNVIHDSATADVVDVIDNRSKETNEKSDSAIADFVDVVDKRSKETNENSDFAIADVVDVIDKGSDETNEILDFAAVGVVDVIDKRSKETNEISDSASTNVVDVIHKKSNNTNLERLELSLAKARYHIKEASLVRNLTSVQDDPDYVPRGPMYRNANAFHRSYLEMEKLFKMYVYEEGEPPMFHNGPSKNIYSTEGSFIHEMEKGNLFRTKDPDQALVYFLPFSVVMLVQYLYKPNSHEINSIGNVVVDYLNVISNRHPFWNRSFGADHFMLSCHDWGPRASSFVPHLFDNSIRALCNANTSEGFNPSKDVSLPEINLRTGEIEGRLGGLSPSRRSILAFFAGRLHGHIRYLLLEQWKEKDEDVQVYEQLPNNGVSYESMLKKSRFCLCPSGYEVASPRVVEAIYAECIPVLISDSYVLPFSDVLNWKSFSVQIPVKEIPNIKKILMGISSNQYLRMQRRVKQVQRHFVVNGVPKRFDVFHMTLHSIWLRRLNIRIRDDGSSLD